MLSFNGFINSSLLFEKKNEVEGFVEKTAKRFDLVEEKDFPRLHLCLFTCLAMNLPLNL